MVLAKQKKPDTQKRKPPNPEKPWLLRIFSRLNGQLIFGKPNDENAWFEAYAAARQTAKEKSGRQQEDLDKIQVRIQEYDKDGVPKNEEPAFNKTADKL